MRNPLNKPKVAARVKAVDLLSRREHSRRELLSKLLGKGYTPEESEDAVDWAMKQGFQSDERFSASLFRRRAATYGDQFIKAELEQHHVAPTAVFSDDSEVRDSEEDRALQWLQRRYSAKLLAILGEGGVDLQPNLIVLKSKALRALGARGFHFHNINSAWVRFLHDHSEDA